MQREILKPQVNIPLLVKLDFGPEGSERDGKFGPQWMYTVNDDQAILFLPLEGREAILASGAEAGDEVALCKRAKGRWEAQRVSDAAEVPEPAPKPAAATHKPVRYMTGSKAAFPASKYAQGVPQTDSPLPISNGSLRDGQQHANGPANGNRHAIPPVSDTPAVKASHPFEERYARMFVVAAHSLALAHAQLTQEGMDLEPFNWEDIRATAIHFAISFERREERKS